MRARDHGGEQALFPVSSTSTVRIYNIEILDKLWCDSKVKCNRQIAGVSGYRKKRNCYRRWLEWVN